MKRRRLHKLGEHPGVIVVPVTPTAGEPWCAATPPPADEHREEREVEEAATEAARTPEPLPVFLPMIHGLDVLA